MPELVEVEAYRRVAERLVGRRIERVVAPDGWFLKRGANPGVLAAALEGATITQTGRVGKLLLLGCASPTCSGAEPMSASPEPAADRCVDAAVQLGLRFGMTGRLIVDGVAGVDTLLYSSDRDDPLWDRFVLELDDGGSMRMRDPRRLGGVELDPDLGRLGPDARSLTLAELTHALRGSAAPIKARLLDQARIAGIGNLIGDEVLWQARTSPLRPSGALGRTAVSRLHAAIGDVIEMLLVRGGSHLGDLMPERHPGGRCPADGTRLRSATIGGRTSWWCPRHQR